VLWRRRITRLPLVAVTLATVVTMAIAFGCTRYRTPFEVVLAILASVAVDGFLNLVRRGGPPTGDGPGDAEEPDPDAAATPTFFGSTPPA